MDNWRHSVISRTPLQELEGFEIERRNDTSSPPFPPFIEFKPPSIERIPHRTEMEWNCFGPGTGPLTRLPGSPSTIAPISNSSDSRRIRSRGLFHDSKKKERKTKRPRIKNDVPPPFPPPIRICKPRGNSAAKRIKRVIL